MLSDWLTHLRPWGADGVVTVLNKFLILKLLHEIRISAI